MNKLFLFVCFIMAANLAYGQEATIDDKPLAKIDSKIILAYTPGNRKETYLQLDIGNGMHQVMTGEKATTYRSSGHALNEVAMLGYEIKFSYKGELDNDIFVFVKKE